MIIAGYFFFVVYVLALFCIGLYYFSQFHLLYSYIFRKKKNHRTYNDPEEWPHVTVQLPVFNEKYVVGRLIDNVAKFDYPKEKLTIHVLDDSTDDTLQISQQQVQKYADLGFDIQLFHREDRTGFKAGALKEGMQHVRSEFIAIFDADFLPDPDFLKKTIPAFGNPKVGVVQTKWEHLNQNFSMLTEMQALQLNVHFTVEQKGRYSSDYFLQFNGTAGVWRTKTIKDAGGWEADTLTEDLDLSYRAQLKGWEIVYMEAVGSPAELPSEIHGLKSQQFRWMKGGAENARKLIPSIWKSPMKFSKKWHAISHLLSSSVFIAVFCLGIFSVPLMICMDYVQLPTHYFHVFLMSFASIVLLYFLVNVVFLRQKESMFLSGIKFIFIFPFFMSISMALAFHNSVAAIQGWLGKKSPFIRTPKYGLSERKKETKYFNHKIDNIVIGEGILAIYFLLAIFVGVRSGVFDFILLHSMLALGYLSLLFYGIKSK